MRVSVDGVGCGQLVHWVTPGWAEVHLEEPNINLGEQVTPPAWYTTAPASMITPAPLDGLW